MEKETVKALIILEVSHRFCWMMLLIFGITPVIEMITAPLYGQMINQQDCIYKPLLCTVIRQKYHFLMFMARLSFS